MADEKVHERFPAPWLAAGMSLLAPGTGEILAGYRALGSALVVLFLCVAIAGSIVPRYPETDLVLRRVLQVATYVMRLLSVFVSWMLVRREILRLPSPPKRWRLLGMDCFLSAWAPGLGHLIACRWIGAFIFLSCAVFVRSASLGEMTASFLRLLVGVAALWHIYVYAVEDYASVRRFVPAFVVLCLCRVLVFLAAVPCSSAPSRDFVISAKGDSMLPSLQPGEVLSVAPRGSEKLPRGAVLILHNPAELASLPNVLKRLVAFEGETVEICGDGIYINNQRWDFLPYGIGYPFAYPSGYALAGNPYKVPSGTVFVMGDNFWNSRDSRFWGALPVDSIKGIALKVVWPLTRLRRLKSPPDNIKPLAADSLTTQPLPAELPGTAGKRENPGDTSPGVK